MLSWHFQSYRSCWKYSHTHKSMSFEIYYLKAGGDSSWVMKEAFTWDLSIITCTYCLPSAWMLTALKNFLFFLHPSTDTILSVVSSEIFGIIGVPSSQLSVCPVQEVEPLCPTAVQLCQWAFMSACLVPSPAPIPLWLLQISPDFQSEV